MRGAHFCWRSLLSSPALHTGPTMYAAASTLHSCASACDRRGRERHVNKRERMRAKQRMRVRRQHRPTVREAVLPHLCDRTQAKPPFRPAQPCNGLDTAMPVFVRGKHMVGTRQDLNSDTSFFVSLFCSPTPLFSLLSSCSVHLCALTSIPAAVDPSSTPLHWTSHDCPLSTVPYRKPHSLAAAPAEGYIVERPTPYRRWHGAVL